VEITKGKWNDTVWFECRVPSCIHQNSQCFSIKCDWTRELKTKQQVPVGIEDRPWFRLNFDQFLAWWKVPFYLVNVTFCFILFVSPKRGTQLLLNKYRLKYGDSFPPTSECALNIYSSLAFPKIHWHEDVSSPWARNPELKTKKWQHSTYPQIKSIRSLTMQRILNVWSFKFFAEPSRVKKVMIKLFFPLVVR